VFVCCKVVCTLPCQIRVSITINSSTNIKKLQCLQNTAARVLPHLSKLPSTSLLRELHWLPVHSRITYKLSCLTYNSLTSGHPGYLCSLINYYTPTHTLQSINQLLLNVHGSPLNLAKDPSATLHRQSGMICLLIQGSPPPLGTDTFQRRLKTFLFT